MAEEPQRLPWARRKFESHKAYAAFLRYRDLGVGRSVHKAAPVPAGQLPKTGKTKYNHWWRDWAAKWEWRVRAEAWDTHLFTVKQDAADKAVIESAIAEAEENEKQREQRLREARSLRAAGRSVFTRFLALIQSGELERITLQRVKHSIEQRSESGSHKTEDETKAITELLDMATKAIEVGQKLERLELGEVTDRTETQSDAKTTHELQGIASSYAHILDRLTIESRGLGDALIRDDSSQPLDTEHAD